jgi:hypothetical protein
LEVISDWTTAIEKIAEDNERSLAQVSKAVFRKSWLPDILERCFKVDDIRVNLPIKDLVTRLKAKKDWQPPGCDHAHPVGS